MVQCLTPHFLTVKYFSSGVNPKAYPANSAQIKKPPCEDFQETCLKLRCEHQHIVGEIEKEAMNRVPKKGSPGSQNESIIISWSLELLPSCNPDHD